MKIADLFCGAGGLGAGFSKAGFDILVAFEYWEKAIQVYNSNFKHTASLMDLSNVVEASTMLEKYPIDGIIGGPPCQDFSSAGKRQESNRADLTIAYSLIVEKIKPGFFVMENVDRVQKSNAYRIARENFKNAGYGLTEIVLDASLCGVPQKRKRFFCIGQLDCADNLLKHELEKRISKKPLTVKNFLKNEIDIEYYYRHPRNYNRRAVYSVHEPSPTIRGVNRPIPPSYEGHPADAGPVDIARPLTTYERSRIQTFPSNWHWAGSKTDVEQMIGNAVPVNLAHMVGEVIYNHVS